MHESPDNRLISLFFSRPQPSDAFSRFFVPNDEQVMELITDPVTGVLRVVGVDPLLWFQPRPTLLPRDLWELIRLVLGIANSELPHIHFFFLLFFFYFFYI